MKVINCQACDTAVELTVANLGNKCPNCPTVYSLNGDRWVDPNTDSVKTVHDALMLAQLAERDTKKCQQRIAELVESIAKLTRTQMMWQTRAKQIAHESCYACAHGERCKEHENLRQLWQVLV